MNVWSKRIKAVCCGFCVSVVLMLLLSLLFSLIVFFSPLAEPSYRLIAPAVNSAALFIGALAAAKKSGEKGILTGVMLSILMLCVMQITGTETDSQPMIKILYCTIAAASGGIMGVR